MEIRTRVLIFLLAFCLESQGFPADEQQYDVEAFLERGDDPTLIFKIRPKSERQPRQEEDEDEDTTQRVPSTTPWIPAVIPGLTKIFQGLITGDLNTIFHGATSFAPQNVSHSIDTVYNQVVGIPPPVSTEPTTRPPFPGQAPQSQPAAAQAQQPQPLSAPQAQAPAPAAPSANAGQPLSQTVVITTTAKPASNEDDDDETDSFFGRL